MGFVKVEQRRTIYYDTKKVGSVFGHSRKVGWKLVVQELVVQDD